MAAARAKVIMAIWRFHTNIGDEACEQSAVDLFVAGFFGCARMATILFFIELFLFELGG